MNDTISRQQTITALRALSDEYGYINAPHEVVTDVVRGLPPVRVEHRQTVHSEQGESDKLAAKMGETWVDVTCPNCGCEIHVEPSAQSEQPEIVRCKDCKYLLPKGSFCSKDMCGLRGMAHYRHVDIYNDFCSWAERREE